MTIPRGNTRKLILALGEIQDLIGKAEAAVLNDRDLNRMEKIIPALEKAFDLCVEARSLYEPIDNIGDQND